MSHQWNVAGVDDYDTSVTGGQCFCAFNLAGGWQIDGSPTFSRNHKADSDSKWTFPLAAATAPDMQNSPEAVNATQEFESGIGAALDCRHEIQAYCQDVTPGQERIVACLQAYEGEPRS